MARIIESAGLLVTIDAFVKDASVFKQETLTTLFKDLVQAIDMEILMGPTFLEVPVDPRTLERSRESGAFLDEGGITGFCIVSKSHVSLHAWPLQEFFSFDVFSCGDFDPDVVLGLVRERLGVTRESVNIVNRKKPLTQAPAVYCITNRIDGKRYVGKSIDPNSRWGMHVWVSSHPNYPGFGPIHAALAKYGVSAFRFETLEVCETEVAALEAERKWISKYQSDDPEKGYNRNSGGFGGLSGPANGMFGRRHTIEARAKMSAANIGRKHPPRSQVHKEAISRARRGEANNMTHLTVAMIQEMRQSARDGCMQMELSRQFRVSVPTVSRILRRVIWKHVL